MKWKLAIIVFGVIGVLGGLTALYVRANEADPVATNDPGLRLNQQHVHGTPTPEPLSLTGLGLGLAGLALRRRRAAKRVLDTDST